MKKLLFVLLILIVATSYAQVPSYVPTNGLVAYYPFNGNANDASGNGNNGTVNGATLTTDRFGNINSTYLFKNKTDFIDLTGKNIAGVGNSQRSIFIWVKTNDSTQYMRLISTGTSAAGQAFNIILMYNGVPVVMGYHPSDYLPNTGLHIADNQWHQVGVTYDGAFIKIYVDGVLQNSSNQFLTTGLVPGGIISYNTSGNNNYFGAPNDPGLSNINRFTGSLDDIAIYNRALSATEIQNLYNSSAPTSCIANIINNDTTICRGQSVTLNVSGANNITNQWQNIASQNDFYTRIQKTNAGYYLCAAQSNSRLYKSIDLTNFTPFSSPLTSHNLSFGKDKNGVLYFGTGHEGIYRSTDNGVSWTYNVAAGFGCGNLDFDFDSSNNLYTGVGGFLRGLYVSNNNGASWQNISNPGSDFTEIECVKPINKTFIITNSYIGVSSNSGQTWTQISNQPFSSNAIMVKHINNVVYVFTKNGNIYRSIDNAVTWTLYSTFPITTTPSIYLNDAILNSNGEWWISIDQNGVFRSTNSGLTWTNESIGISGGTNYLFKDNNTIILTTSTGIYKRNNNTSTYLWSTGATTPSITVSPTVTTTYYLTVTDANGNTCRDSIKVFVNTAIPSAPATLTGATDVCPNFSSTTSATSNAVTYTAATVSTATSYTWTVPAGVTIVSGQGTNSITVTFASTFVSGAITVKSVNVCGASTSAKSLTVYKRVAATPGTIQKQFSPTSITAVTNVTGLVSETYRIRKVTYATSYNWSMNRGTSATITHINPLGANDTAVIVTFANCFLRDTLSVKSVTPCSVSAARTAILVGYTTPAAVAGITTVGGNFATCIGVNKTFTAVRGTPTTTQAPITSFRWTRPANTSIVSATSDSASITVSFNTGYTGGSISAKGVSQCGTIGTTASTAILQFLPPSVLSIASSTGSYNACIGNSITYSALVGAPTTSQVAASVFRWTKPNNSTITSASADSSTITLQFNIGYIGGTLSVRGQTSCGTQGTAKTQALTHAGCAAGTKMSVPVTTTTTNSFEVSLYPNPSAGEFKLLVNFVGGKTPTMATPTMAAAKATVKIIDLQGRLIKSFECNANQVTALGNELKPGVYMVEVRMGNEVKTVRAVRF